jgi:hypothetical protein
MRPFPMLNIPNRMIINNRYEMQIPTMENPYNAYSPTSFPQSTFQPEMYPPMMHNQLYQMQNNHHIEGLQVPQQFYSQSDEGSYHPQSQLGHVDTGMDYQQNSFNHPWHQNIPQNQYEQNGINQYFPIQQPPISQSSHKPLVGTSQSPFANPLQSKKANIQMANQYPNPYPKQAFMQKTQPSGFQSIMNQFKTQDGTIDVNKMMNTAGQMMGTVNQVQSMFKGIGGFFKTTSS